MGPALAQDWTARAFVSGTDIASLRSPKPTQNAMRDKLSPQERRCHRVVGRGKHFPRSRAGASRSLCWEDGWMLHTGKLGPQLLHQRSHISKNVIEPFHPEVVSPSWLLV